MFSCLLACLLACLHVSLLTCIWTQHAIIIFMQYHSSKFDKLVNAFGQVTDSRVLYTTSRIACDCALAGVAMRPLLNFVFALLRFRICVCVYVYVLCFLFVMFHSCGSEFWSMDICVKHFALCALRELKSAPKKCPQKAPKWPQ